MTLQDQDLLGAQRAVYVLAEKPGTTEIDSKLYWYLKLNGLHPEHLKSAVAHLRKRELGGAKTTSQKRALKSTSLQNSLARALGAQSYDHWLEHEQPKILSFLAQHGLKRPADLLKWAYPPGFAGKLTARQISDRIFNSGLPLPQRIFTGVGSYLFAPSGYGRMDIDGLAGERFSTDTERLVFCRKHADTVLMRAEEMKGTDGPAYIDLTGRALMLNAVSEYVGCMYNMLGNNLVDTTLGDPVMRSYNTTDADRAFELQIFDLFREEIQRSGAGWVEVLAVPGNQNLVFLKGTNGTFDWVVRDQRDEALSSNPLYPFFDKDEIPQAMDNSQIAAHLYFTRGSWQEKLEHDAETRHYEEGGTTADWPGYPKLIERELVASLRAVPPRRVSGSASERFVSHRIDGYRLMVSPLITIDQFSSFLSETGWHRTRLEKAEKAKIELERNLWSVNVGDTKDLPVSVTWLDAVAYCRDYQQRHGLPVRLLETEEWRQIVPPPLEECSRHDRIFGEPINSKVLESYSLQTGELPDEPIYEELGWGMFDGDGKLRRHSPPFFYRPERTVSFGKDLHWTSNGEGLPFISQIGFGEWLSPLQSLSAPAACVATGKAVAGGPIERDLLPVHEALRYKFVKIGFRLCYVAHPDA